MGGTVRTLWLFMLLTVMMAIIGFALGGFYGNPVLATLLFVAIAGTMNFVMFFWGDKIVLKTYRAKVVNREEAPRLYGIVERLALKGDLPMPTVAIIPTNNPNAFATGRSPKHATVAATVGILQMLDDEELEGVMAHELAHVSNRDMLVMTTAATIAGAISFAARMFFWGQLFGGNRGGGSPAHLALALVVMITAPLAAILVQLAISRTREYKADASGAKLCGKPWALARALQKIERGNQVTPLQGGNPAHSALFISNPFRGGAFAKMFATHPPTEERVRRLERMM
jgi:heat shock protein HtpX